MKGLTTFLELFQVPALLLPTKLSVGSTVVVALLLLLVHIYL